MLEQAHVRRAVRAVAEPARAAGLARPWPVAALEAQAAERHAADEPLGLAVRADRGRLGVERGGVVEPAARLVEAEPLVDLRGDARALGERERAAGEELRQEEHLVRDDLAARAPARLDGTRGRDTLRAEPAEPEDQRRRDGTRGELHAVHHDRPNRHGKFLPARPYW
jgi:hypothetical protein